MAANVLSPERALIRLRQLAREQRTAIAHGDVEALCRISELLPSTVGALGTTAPTDPDALSVIEEARLVQIEAEQFLTQRMGQVKGLLQQLSRSQISARAYASASGKSQRIDGSL